MPPPSSLPSSVKVIDKQIFSAALRSTATLLAAQLIRALKHITGDWVAPKHYNQYNGVAKGT